MGKLFLFAPTLVTLLVGLILWFPIFGRWVGNKVQYQIYKPFPA